MLVLRSKKFRYKWYILANILYMHGKYAEYMHDTRFHLDPSNMAVWMKTVNWLVSEVTQTASEIWGLLSLSEILYWFVWEEGFLVGGKTKQKRADNTVRDPSVFVWEEGLLNTWGTEFKKLNLFLSLFVDSQKDACFCCCCTSNKEISWMRGENVFKNLLLQVLLPPQST